MKFEKFFWGYYRGFEAWFCRFSGGRGGVYALRLKAFQPRCFCPLGLLSVRLLAFIGCIVSIHTDNKYYVTSPLFCLLAYVYMSELLTPLKWLANRLKFNFKAGWTIAGFYAVDFYPLPLIYCPSWAVRLAVTFMPVCLKALWLLIFKPFCLDFSLLNAFIVLLLTFFDTFI